MTHFALLLGSALVAFGPLLSFFFVVIYHKAQLVIIVTTAAFFFLLSALGASVVWWLFQAVGLDGLVAILVPGVLSQFLFRCAFVALYHKVEKVIRLSIEQEDDARHATNNAVAANHRQGGQDEDQAEDNNSEESWSNVAKLRLQLNDASCGIAAGVGFGGMHAIMLYGSLLASESDNKGVLYQQSCPSIPSLAQSAVFAFCFSVMDIFWMLLTFFGMRRRLLYHRGRQFEENQRVFGSYFGNSRNGGNLALMFVLVMHLASALSTTASAFGHGCIVALPLLVAAMCVTMYTFWAGTARIYMPPENSDQSISRVASRVSSVGGDSGSRLRED